MAQTFTENWDFSGNIEDDANWDVLSDGTSTDFDADGDAAVCPNAHYKSYMGIYQDTVDTISQSVKMEMKDATIYTEEWAAYGAILRQSDADGTGVHYQLIVSGQGDGTVYFRAIRRTGTTYNEEVGEIAITVPDDGDWIGFAVADTGNDTYFYYWDFGGSDPDAGKLWDGVEGAESNWGNYTKRLDDNPGTAVDSGSYVGVWVAYGLQSNPCEVDTWVGGDTAAAAGASASPSDVSIAATVADITITRMRDLGITDVSAAATVADAAVNRMRQLGITDVASAASVANVAIDICRDVQITDITSAVSVGSAALTRMRTLGITDINVASSVGTTALIRARQLGITDVASATTVATVAVSVAGEIGISVEDVEVAVTVAAATITRLRQIGITDINVATSVTDVVLDVTEVGNVGIDISDMSVATSIVDAVITRMRSLGITDIGIAASVANVAVSLAGEVTYRRRGLLLGVY